MPHLSFYAVQGLPAGPEGAAIRVLVTLLDICLSLSVFADQGLPAGLGRASGRGCGAALDAHEGRRGEECTLGRLLLRCASACWCVPLWYAVLRPVCSASLHIPTHSTAVGGAALWRGLLPRLPPVGAGGAAAQVRRPNWAEAASMATLQQGGFGCSWLGVVCLEPCTAAQLPNCRSALLSLVPSCALAPADYRGCSAAQLLASYFVPLRLPFFPTCTQLALAVRHQARAHAV